MHDGHRRERASRNKEGTVRKGDDMTTMRFFWRGRCENLSGTKALSFNMGLCPATPGARAKYSHWSKPFQNLESLLKRQPGATENF